jgi:hypothetical protein
MKALAVAIALCALAASGNADADQTCKAKAVQQKLTGAALLNFVKQCEFDALAACANLAAGKPDSDSFLSSPRASKRCSGGIPWNRYYSPSHVGRLTRSYRGEADITQPKIHEDENPDHQKGEAMDPPLLAIADGFRERTGKVRETR